MFGFAVRACFLPSQAASQFFPLASSLTAFHLPVGTTYQELHDRLRAAGFVIYAGQGQLAKKIFRIATMGDIGRPDLERFFEVFGEP